ncbi:signal recognition particle-docking protein FtsY [Pasteurellaceae bacterium Pebbles2]|nr:signal recognition particle-docking protein FtsY [Pasteurellaceae bacterium Pebbles2]
MADDKKKNGFWSWLGLGKKKEETLSETPEITEKVDDFVEDVKQKIEDIAEKVEDTIEQKLEQISENLSEESIEIVENIVQSEADLTAQQQATLLEPVKTEQLSAEISQPAPTLEQTEHQPLNEEEFEEKSAVEISPVLVSEEENQDNNEQDTAENKAELEQIPEEFTTSETAITQEKPSEGGFFSRLLKGLVKTKQNIGAGFRSFFLGKKIDDELFEELEEQLLIADIGVPTTQKIIKNLEQHATRQQLKDADLLYQQLKEEMATILRPVEQPLQIDGTKKPYVILMVGVNGVGKTTTIGKLARQFQQQGKSVMLAAGDTFRAAAVEQLQVWGERNHIPVVAQSTGSDSASVIFDAMQSAAARNIDILIADTAGRLQNKNNLMDELKKIVRVMKKYDETAPHEIMLTLDAGTGQNAISQAKLFNEAVGLTGISLTKLDGTAKGGVIFAIADQFNLPIRYIGVGEKIEDLRTFNATEFIDALFTHEED